jgi:hypothetical protein
MSPTPRQPPLPLLATVLGVGTLCSLVCIVSSRGRSPSCVCKRASADCRGGRGGGRECRGLSPPRPHRRMGWVGTIWAAETAHRSSLRFLPISRPGRSWPRTVSVVVPLRPGVPVCTTAGQGTARHPPAQPPKQQSAASARAVEVAAAPAAAATAPTGAARAGTKVMQSKKNDDDKRTHLKTTVPFALLCFALLCFA